MTRRVIFIASANHSGSTLVGCILGADPISPLRNFHVGEMHAFFAKHNMARHRNTNVVNNLSPEGHLWSTVDTEVGYSNAYREIFGKIDPLTIIDSSKAPKHLETQLEACRKHKWPFQVVVTIRPFRKIWDSGTKRKHNEDTCIRNIRNFVRTKEVLERERLDFTVVDIDQLIRDPVRITRTLCETVDIPYFEGKEQYWNFKHAYLFGATTQRQHLLKPATAKFKAKEPEVERSPTPSFLNTQEMIETEAFFRSKIIG